MLQLDAKMWFRSLGCNSFAARGGGNCFKAGYCRFRLSVVELLMKLIDTIQHAAKTHTFLAASVEVKKKDAHTQY